MTGVTIRSDARGLLIALERELQDPSALLDALGLRILREIDDIFRAQGKPPWEPLRPSTVAAKRQGKGSGSPQALAGLRNTFDSTQTGPRQQTVSPKKQASHRVGGTPIWQIAGFHEFGTKGPYEIRPRVAKALALPFLPGRDAGTGTSGKGKAGRFSLKGLGRSTPTGRGSFSTPKGRRVPYTNVTFRKSVTHPGLPKRPLLPSPEQAVPIVEKETAAFLRNRIAKRGGG